ADAGVGPSAAWGDYDNDGYLDLYVVNHAVCTHGSRGSMSEPDVLYHNDGDGTFTDVTDQLPPLGSTDGAGFQAAWVDYNGDGRQDLYLANDSYYSPSDRNHLWRNDGPGLGGTWRFTDVSALSGADYSINSMGIGIADVDRDLDLDMAISNKQGNVLARNNGDGTFTDVAGPAGVQRPLQNADQNAITWGLAFGDLNLDGWEDLYVASGPILAGNAQPNELFVNTGHGGVFADLSAPSQALVPGISRGLAFADYDRDGRIDVYVVRLGGSPVLLHNITDTSGLHWLEVQTVGTVSNRQGCGARLVLTVGKVRLLREVFCGSTSLSSGSDPTAHFGLGGHAGPLSLTVDWPSGARSVVSGLSADRLVQVIEPS
ncbi:MAG TPA: CRTAC1 family protein, partial [Actinomycetota bacterium]|nr:CRTAC1 family protein [Actinomycetota bacterium]